MTAGGLAELVDKLRASRFRDVSGLSVTATVPLSERLLNDLIAASLRQGGAVREASVHPQPQNRLNVRVKLMRAEFLPAMSATLLIEQQPELPHRPLLVFRVTGLPGLLALAGPLVSLQSRLPPGVRLDGDLLALDLRELAARYGQGEFFGYVRRLRLNSEAGRLLIECEAGVD